jgi:hypothetical protein
MKLNKKFFHELDDRDEACQNQFVVIFLPADAKRNALLLVKADWKTQYHLSLGRCFTFSVPDWLLKLIVEKISFRLKMNSYIYFHHPKQFNKDFTHVKLPGIVGKSMFLDVAHDVS